MTQEKTLSRKIWQGFAKYYLFLLLILVVFVGGYILGRQTNPVLDVKIKDTNGQVYNKDAKPAFLSKNLDFELFWETWDIIRENYLRQPVNETEMLYGAMAGSVASLGDPHTVFFDPETTQKFTDELNGTFDGIGAEIAMKNDRVTVVAPLPDSPAEKAGLLPGDKIYAIDGEDTTGVSLDYAVSKIRGPQGTEVVLTISRDGWTEVKEIKITRNKIKIESVKWTMLKDNVAHLELRYFNEDTSAAFAKAVMEIVDKNPRGIIFDLRNNPGGFLDTAIEVASEWIEEGPVTFERTADGKLKEHDAIGQARLKDFFTVVLVNEGSASGSEIVAGALKDYGLATLIGEKTFGKGSVQTLFSLRDGSSIKLTIAEWLTPHENTIDKEGIEPDIKVSLGKEEFNKDQDPQLDKALSVILEKTQK